MSPAVHLALAFAAIGWSAAASAATFGDLSGGPAPEGYAAYAPGPYAASPYGAYPQRWGYGQPGAYAYPPNAMRPVAPGLSGGPEGMPPAALDAPGFAAAPPPPPMPAYRQGAGLPNGPMQMASFQQINSTTDPYNAWGLSTPFMFVPWSTPLSGWTNAQTWNWWRERSGAPSYGW